MLAQAGSKSRSLHSDGGTQPTVPIDLHRRPDGSINYELFELRARQLRAAFLAAALAAGMRALSRALKAVAVMIHQLLHGSPVAVPQRR